MDATAIRAAEKEDHEQGIDEQDICDGVVSFLTTNWLRVLDIAELAQVNQRIRQQLHPIVPLLDAFKTQ